MLNRRADKLELLRIAEAVALEKSIDKELIINSMETGIAKAAKSKFGNENEIFLSFTSSSWIEIYVNNELIEAQQFKAGDTYSRKVQIPFKIVVGNADSLKGTYNGEMIDFSTDNDSLYGVKTVLFDDE